MNLIFSISILVITTLFSTSLYSQTNSSTESGKIAGNFVSNIISPSDSIISNSKFLKTITSKRATCEKMVISLIGSRLDVSDQKLMYDDVRKAYNLILDKMDIDISKIDNLAEFALSNTSAYQEDLKEAEVLERRFMAASNSRLGQDASFMSEIFKEVLDLLPGVKQIHDITLKMLKNRIRTSVKNARFRKWEVEGVL
jgi:hypothetical protein